MEKNTLSVKELHEAVRSNKTELVAELLKQGVDPNGTQGIDRWTPLHYAATNGHSDCAQQLITAGAEVDVKSKNGNTPLHYAAWGGHSDCFQQLITAGAEVDVKDKAGETPLHHAAWEGHSDCAQQLITAGAEVDVKNKNGETPLHNAAWGGHSDCAQQLITAGADVNVHDQNGWTPLHRAAANGRSACAQQLITAGAEVDAKDKDGETPLHNAAVKGHSDSAQQLITAGAEADVKNNNGDTALILAAMRRKTQSCKTLIDAGVDVHHQNQQGDTALIAAARCRRTKMLCGMLLSAKANMMQTNNNGKTALDVADESGNTEVAALLRKYADKQAKEKQKKNTEPDDSYYSAPTPAFLPMSPGGWDEIMAQSPATWDVANDVLHEDGFTDTISAEADEKTKHTFAVPASPPPVSTRNQGTRSPLPRSSSSLFDVDPSLPQTSQQTVDHPLHSSPLGDLHQENSIKSSDDKIQALLKQMKEQEEELKNIIKEKDETIAQKGDKIKNQDQTITNKGDKLVSKGDQIKQQTEIIEETQQELTNKDRKLKGKGKRIYECEEVIEEQDKLLKDKDKRLAVKQERITEMEKYQEEQLKKIRIGRDENEVSNTQKQSLHATKANYKLTPQQSMFVLDQILPSICQIEVPGFCGTGFIVGGISDSNTGLTHRYVLTCYHVRVKDALRDRHTCVAIFESTLVPIRVNVITPALFWNKDMDYVLIKLEFDPALEQLLAGKQALGQLVTVDDPVHNDALVLCAHADRQVIDWGARAVCIDDEEVKRKHGDLSVINQRRQHSTQHYPLTRKFMFYDCSCQAGTSGAPCLSAPQTRIYAMHCGTAYKERLELEYGVLLKCVVHDIADNIRNLASVPGASNMQQGGLWLDQLSKLFPQLSSVIFPNTAMNIDNSHC